MPVASAPIGRGRGSSGGGKGRSWWWGSGAPPHERWPRVTLEVPTQWSSARRRWETPDGRYYFDAQAAADAVEFFPDILKHHLGEFAGQPFRLMEYQDKCLTRPLFGWKRADGLRRFRKVFGFIPKGGGKSPWAAGTGVFLARCDSEMGAEVYALANDRNQARTVHTNAKYMVEDSPLLKDGAEILKDAIYWEDTRSTYMVLSSDASSAHGKRPHGLIVDEMHGFVGDRYRELFEALKKSLIKRRQPVLIMISHAGTDDESLCAEEYEYAKALLGGHIEDDTCLPVIFEMTPDDDWTSPAVHARVNPGYGITVKAEAVEAECLEAQNEPRKRNDFLRYHGNRWVNQATAWIPIEWWDADLNKAAVPDDAALAALPCAAGIDMAQKIDLACFALVFRHPLKEALRVDAVPGDALAAGADAPPPVKTVDLNYRITILPFFWIPEDTMQQREREDGLPYASWRELGLVTATEGSVIDYTKIFTDITEKIVPRFPRLRQSTIGYDPAFATDIASKLRAFAGRDEWCLEVLQNYAHLSEVCYVFEALVKAARVSHGGHRVLRNHIEHVAIKTDDARRIRPVKPKKAGKHIDGVVASLMGLKMLATVPDRRTTVVAEWL